MLEMLFRPKGTRCRKNKILLALWNEINTNLERFYVIDQQGFISCEFETQALDELRNIPGTKLQEELTSYAALMDDFNAAFHDCRAFEKEYSSAMEHKTIENARILEAKKDALEERLHDIRPTIEAAQKALTALLK